MVLGHGNVRLPFGRFITVTTDLLWIVLKAYTSLRSRHQCPVKSFTVAKWNLPGSMMALGISWTGKSFPVVKLCQHSKSQGKTDQEITQGKYKNCLQLCSVCACEVHCTGSSATSFSNKFRNGHLALWIS